MIFKLQLKFIVILGKLLALLLRLEYLCVQNTDVFFQSINYSEILGPNLFSSLIVAIHRLVQGTLKLSELCFGA